MPLLKIDIEARYAQFQDALNAIQRDTKKAAGNMSRDFESVKGVLAGVGSVVSVGVITAVIKNAIDAADSLRDLSQQTGIAVENLGGLGFAAGQAGGNLDSIAEAAGQLNKSLAGAGSGEQKFIEGFKALGIEIRNAEGDLKKADQILIEIADKFEKYADGPEKAAIAQRLFKTSGRELISFLNEGGAAIQENIDFYKKFSGATEDLSDKSDEFNDAMGKLSVISGSIGNTLAREVLPILNAVSKEMIDSADGADRFSLAGAALRTLLETLVIAGSDIAHTFRMVGDEIGGTAARLALLGKGEFKLAWDMGDIMDADQQAALKRLEEFQARVMGRTSGSAPATGSGAPSSQDKPKPKPRAPRLPGSGSDASAKILDNRLRDLERMSDDEQRLLATRSEFLQSYYQNDLISINDYFDGLRASQEESLKTRSDIIQKEIDLIRSSRPKDAQESAAKDSKVADLLARQAALEKEVGLAGIKAFAEQDRAAKEFANTLAGINAELLEQRGLLPDAAGIRFDLGTEKIRTKITTERDSETVRANNGHADAATNVAAANAALAKLDTMRNLAVAQARLNSLSDDGARVQDDLTEATERAQLAAEQGSITELEGLRKVSDARRQAVVDLQRIADAMVKVANETGSDKAIQNARAFQLAIDKLATSADLLRDKFQQALTGPFESAIEKMINGTASLKDAFKGLFADVGRELAKLAAQSITKQLFSNGGPLHGLPLLAAQVFGSANGNVFNAGNVVPFAKGGMPDIVSAPMYFPMKDGKTGLMGEAGPEAIMPLTRGRDGLSITALDERGKAALLPVTRDASGKMAVRQPQAFATGGVFTGGSLVAAANTVQGPRAEMMQLAGTSSDQRPIHLVQNFAISGQTNAASQAQIAAAAAQGVARGKRNL